MSEGFEFFNPWNVKSLDDFLFYCCPECEQRNINKSDFIKHVVTNHPKSQEFIDLLEGTNHTNLDECETVYLNNDTIHAVIAVKCEPIETSIEPIDESITQTESGFKLKDVSVKLTRLSESEIRKHTNQPSKLEVTPDATKGESAYKCNKYRCNSVFDSETDWVVHDLFFHKKTANVSKPSQPKRVPSKTSSTIVKVGANVETSEPNEQESGVLIFKCDRCPAAFRDPNYLDQHVIFNHIKQKYGTNSRKGIKKVKDELVAKSRTKVYESHESDVMVWLCNQCGKMGKGQVNLKEHKKRCNENKESKVCSLPPSKIDDPLAMPQDTEISKDPIENDHIQDMEIVDNLKQEEEENVLVKYD